MYKDIAQRNSGRLPIVVIDKDINDRMASTVRHNHVPVASIPLMA